MDGKLDDEIDSVDVDWLDKRTENAERKNPRSSRTCLACVESYARARSTFLFKDLIVIAIATFNFLQSPTNSTRIVYKNRVC